MRNYSCKALKLNQLSAFIVKKITKKQLQILILFYYEELPHAKVAQVLEMQEAEVKHIWEKTRVQLAKKILKLGYSPKNVLRGIYA